MTFSTRTYLCCDQCSAEFGGPNAGDYADWDGKLSGISVEDYLVGEAKAMYWIEISCGATPIIVCSKKCAKEFIDSEECYADARPSN